MSTSVREQVFAYVAGTSLMQIDGSDPYTNTIAKVYRTMQHPDALGAEVPAICMVEGEREPDSGHPHTVLKGYWIVPLTLVLFVRNSSNLEPATVVNSWEADCDLAMVGGNNNGNRQQGGKAHNTDPLGSELLQLEDEYAPAWIGGTINYNLHYSQHWADPTLT